MKYIRPLFMVTFALSCITLFYFSLSYFEQREAPKKSIKVIAQTGPLKEGLKTDYLAELLDISVDQSQSLDCEKAERCLLKSPLIKTVEVSYLNSETLYIDYTLRTPQFALIDLENRALDEEGVTFPLMPHITPKRLPELFLGLKALGELETIYTPQKKWIAKRLTKLLGHELVRVDLSHFEESSLGKQEIVVIVQQGGYKHFLRLSTQKFEKQLSHYLAMKEKMQGRELIIDLRVPDLAYLTPHTDPSKTPDCY